MIILAYSKNPEYIGVNAAGDAGDSSPTMVRLQGTAIESVPKKFGNKILKNVMYFLSKNSQLLSVLPYSLTLFMQAA